MAGRVGIYLLRIIITVSSLRGYILRWTKAKKPSRLEGLPLCVTSCSRPYREFELCEGKLPVDFKIRLITQYFRLQCISLPAPFYLLRTVNLGMGPAEEKKAMLWATFERAFKMGQNLQHCEWIGMQPLNCGTAVASLNHIEVSLILLVFYLLHNFLSSQTLLHVFLSVTSSFALALFYCSYTGCWIL